MLGRIPESKIYNFAYAKLELKFRKQLVPGHLQWEKQPFADICLIKLKPAHGLIPTGAG